MTISRFSLIVVGLAAVFGLGFVAGGLMHWKSAAGLDFPANNTEIGKIFRIDLRRGSDQARQKALGEYLKKISTDRLRAYQELSEAGFVTRYLRRISNKNGGDCVQFTRQDDRFFGPVGYWNVSFCGDTVNVILDRPSL